MPFEVVAIDNLYNSVDRPVITKVIRDVMNVTKISPQTKIYFFGLDQAAPQAGSTLGELGVENRWPYDEKVIVEVSEEFDPSNVLATNINRRDVPPIFEDVELGVRIQPVYALTQVKISLKYQARDHNQAHTWRNLLRGRVSTMQSTVMLHEVEYDFTINEALLDVVANIWSLRENVAGYGESFGEYLTNGLMANVHLISSQSGETRLWSAREKQSRVQGYFTFEGIADKPEKEGNHDNYAVSAEYTFEYQKPLFLHIQYPMVVHNQLMPVEFLPIEKMKRPEESPLRYSLSGKALGYFESGQRQIRNRGFDGIAVPEYDDFMPAMVLNTTVRIMTVVVTISEGDKRSLLNLNDLATYALNDEVLAWMKLGEYPFMTKLYQSIFQLSLYSGQLLQPQELLTIDDQLNVVATEDLDIRSTYRLRLSLVTDHRYLPTKAVARLRENPVIGIRICEAINSCLRGYNGSRKDVPSTQLTAEDVLYMTGKTLPIYHKRELAPQFSAVFFTDVRVSG